MKPSIKLPIKPLASLFLFLLVGCISFYQPDLPTNIETPATLPAPQGGIDVVQNPEGILSISMRNPQTLNPILNTDPTVSWVLGLIYQPLFEMDNLTPMPVLAQSIHMTENYTHAVVVLANRTWADGVPITAQDVVFTLQTIQNNSQSPYHDMISNIAGFQALDARSVQFTFNSPVGGRVQYSLLFPIIPAHFFAGQLGVRNMQALGSGPFMVQRIAFPREMMLVHNPHSPVMPNIAAVQVIIAQNRSTEFYSLNQGIINALRGTIADFGQYTVSPVGLSIIPYATQKFDFLAFNFDNIILGSVHVRQAIAYLLPVTESIYTAYLGQAQRTSSVVHPTSHLYLHYLNYRISDENRAWELFGQAGYGDVGDNTLGSVVAGVPVPMPPLRILVNTESHERMTVAGLLSQNLESVGIQVEMIAVDFEQYIQEVQNRNFDMLFAGVDLERDLRFLLYSTGSNNLMNYSSAVLDEYLENAANAISTELYQLAWNDIQTYVNEMLPIVGIAFRNGVVFAGSGLYVPSSPSISNMYKGVEHWVLH
ncbi:MAG: ABC transporter substrate-binding protein [Defluviitaleaceae bacterium]|nr:ABC transporter substrate-binding protein [Defluviitaleaceae bacterium]